MTISHFMKFGQESHTIRQTVNKNDALLFVFRDLPHRWCP